MGREICYLALNGVFITMDGYLAGGIFEAENQSFIAAFVGKYEIKEDNTIAYTIDCSSDRPDLKGTTITKKFEIKGDQLDFEDDEYDWR